MKIRYLVAIIVCLSELLAEGAFAQTDSLAGEKTTVTSWSTNLKVFVSDESYGWDVNSFDDAVLDTSKLVISRAGVYGAISLATSFSTRGFENEWNIALGKLTHHDDLMVIDLGIGGVFGSIPKTVVSNQAASISYYSNSPGNPLKQGTATYTYSIQGSYVGATIPLMLEWRYGMKPISLNGRIGMLYRIASVTVDRKLSANGFPQDYDVSMNEGRFAYFNDYDLTENFDRKVSQLIIAAIPCIGISARLPFTSVDEGYGLIVGADFGMATRLYVAITY
ncbi:MAG: hypothetical protein WBZ48_01865 [Bacteroidota bacterium]